MTLLVDAAPLVALADRGDRMHRRVSDVLAAEPGSLVVPAPVTAEVDYLLGRRFGRQARRGFLDDLAVGRFLVESLERSDYATVLELDRTYDDLDAGLADLSVVVLARRHETHRVLTFDERRFRVLRPLDGGAFTLLPADE